MRTEDDLRATFSALEHQAPDPIGALAGLDRLRQRRTTRRRTVVAAVAVVTMALAVGSLAGPNLFRDNSPATQARTPLKSPFAVDPVPGFRIAYQIVDPRLPDQATFFRTRDNLPPSGTIDRYRINVFDAGQYDPAAVKTGESIDVRGKPVSTGPTCPAITLFRASSSASPGSTRRTPGRGSGTPTSTGSPRPR